MGKRLVGSDMDSSFQNFDGKGFWKDYIGYRCSYAVEMLKI